MAAQVLAPLRQGEALAVGDVMPTDIFEFRESVIGAVRSGQSLAALFGQPLGDQRVRLWAVLADRGSGELTLCTAEPGDHYPALTPDCPPAHWFEREIAEQWGIVPEGHPWFKPIRFHRSYRRQYDAWSRTAGDALLPSVTDFFQVAGAGVHEVAVGPVHAGVIEPGHFRFQCHGEHVFHLEISLGYQHRGIERALVGGPNARTIHYMETLAGDTSVGHATAYCQALEALAGCEPPLKAEALRGIGLELERLACHTGDLGALASDVGYLPTASFNGRLRGEFLNATALLCGSRFGRGLVRPGGVGFDLDAGRIQTLCERLETALEETNGSNDLLWRSLSVQARFEGTGIVSEQECRELGLVGPAARACGFDRDVRQDFPQGVFRFSQLPVSTCASGDVFARAYVRGMEIQRSGAFVLEQLRTLPGGPTRVPLQPLAPNSVAVSLVEGWRGEICHVAITDADGRLACYKVVDPSFHNWIGLAMALRDEQISDFPLCNKSFNLSYCGHDL
ncbi:MAG TPA: NADH-quinone oxidoreductase subunit C [Pirellulales bacterium]|nr:NADH-quinone oxidoreductase subunit C [Pirellulales bacterium]